MKRRLSVLHDYNPWLQPSFTYAVLGLVKAKDLTFPFSQSLLPPALLSWRLHRARGANMFARANKQYEQSTRKHAGTKDEIGAGKFASIPMTRPKS